MTDVLAVGPHPDDVELAAGGTVALCATRGLGVVVCDLTRGYLVGIASTLTGYEWGCTETACISKGDPECIYVLKAK